MADDTAATLDAVLGAYYKASAMGQGSKQAAFDAYANARDSDPALEPMAQAKLTELKKVNVKRCVITATKVEFLTQALSR